MYQSRADIMTAFITSRINILMGNHANHSVAIKVLKYFTSISVSVNDPMIEWIDIGTIECLNSTLFATMKSKPRAKKVDPVT